MMASFVLTPEAAADARAIWEHAASKGSEATADRFVAHLFDACDKLAGMPGMGHYREDLLDKRHRFWSVKSYLIVYRWRPVPLQVVSIVYGARDLNGFFGK